MRPFWNKKAEITSALGTRPQTSVCLQWLGAPPPEPLRYYSCLLLQVC